MVYLRNNTRLEQWLEDPYTGIKRRVEADALARVTVETADLALRSAPSIWVRVIPITPPPPPGNDLPS